MEIIIFLKDLPRYLVPPPRGIEVVADQEQFQVHWAFGFERHCGAPS